MNILHLENNSRDAELTLQTLCQHLTKCSIEQVATKEAFVSRLNHVHYDLVLSDFSMEGFSGFEALEIARARVPDIPFIFFSGTVGEERGIEALRRGASDYIVKDRPQRLIPAIERAIEVAQISRDRSAAENQLQRIQRIENIGMLAAGVAHDFNNILTPLLMGISLLRARHAGPLDQRILTSMESSANRGAGLIRQILTFSHGVNGGALFIQPFHILREVSALVQQTFPKAIELEDDFTPTLWPVKVNPTQFHQVLLNLCVNARDAMPAGGKLTLKAENRTLDPAGAAGLENAAPGSYVVITVADTGSGIPKAILDKIWQPFFTTKAPGKGTGLGLSTVKAIMEEHSGSIQLRTDLGRGTQFELFFLADPTAATLHESAETAEAPRGAGELVLVVDDDANVREITAATLAAHGYSVMVAAEGTEALAILAPRALEFRAMVTDLDMPGLDGIALAKVALTLNPLLKVLLVSGTSDSRDPRCDAPIGGRHLAKPFSAEMLLRTTHEMLAVAVLPFPEIVSPV